MPVNWQKKVRASTQKKSATVKRSIRCCLKVNGKNVTEEILGQTGHARQLLKFSAMNKNTMNLWILPCLPSKNKAPASVFYIINRNKNGITPLIIVRHEDEVGARSGTSIKISKMTPFDQPNPV